jgi:hypothetical protein
MRKSALDVAMPRPRTDEGIVETLQRVDALQVAS